MHECVHRVLPPKSSLLRSDQYPQSNQCIGRLRMHRSGVPHVPTPRRAAMRIGTGHAHGPSTVWSERFGTRIIRHPFAAGIITHELAHAVHAVIISRKGTLPQLSNFDPLTESCIDSGRASASADLWAKSDVRASSRALTTASATTQCRPAKVLLLLSAICKVISAITSPYLRVCLGCLYSKLGIVPADVQWLAMCRAGASSHPAFHRTGRWS